MFLAVCNKSISYQSRKILFCSLSRKQINIWGKKLFLLTPSWLVSHFQHVYFVLSLYVIVVIRTHNNASVKTWKNLSPVLYPLYVTFSTKKVFYCCSTSQWKCRKRVKHLKWILTVLIQLISATIVTLFWFHEAHRNDIKYVKFLRLTSHTQHNYLTCSKKL